MTLIQLKLGKPVGFGISTRVASTHRWVMYKQAGAGGFDY
ncbi:hypothetical protein SAMN02745223_01652 [Devosia limi DSM 17137]|uniref:Uncharacterized protein n=1 Tax=Devosia limi DSM 17137 TaxID=1121477 RepID=A0A1M4YFC5_9HYPH|nr:hypothetical protein SAMN02745223_01652 [Devosia limi DSM 17137]